MRNSISFHAAQLRARGSAICAIRVIIVQLGDTTACFNFYRCIKYEVKSSETNIFNMSWNQVGTHMEFRAAFS